MTEHKDIRSARNVYRWLWLSPFLTIPTLIFVIVREPGYELLCHGSSIGCDWPKASLVDGVIAVLVSSVWHPVVLLRPRQGKTQPFVHWHRLQALLLTAIRTAVPLMLWIIAPDSVIVLAIPVLLLIWLFGTLWGRRQAMHGKCSLARWAGREHEITPIRDAKGHPSLETDPAVAMLIGAIRFGKKPAVRQDALTQLTDLGMVETL